MSLSAPFPYTIDEDVKRRNPTAVFKLRFGLSKEKYFIFKGLRINNTVETLSAQIHKERMYPKEDSLLFRAIAYIKRSKVTSMSVEVICEQDSPVELLMCEYEALQLAKKDPNCLNTRFLNNEYFPKWIPQNAVNEFTAKLHGVKIPDTHKLLIRFLNNHIDDRELVDRIVTYVRKHYRPGNESHKNLSKKRNKSHT